MQHFDTFDCIFAIGADVCIECLTSVIDSVDAVSGTIIDKGTEYAQVMVSVGVNGSEHDRGLIGRVGDSWISAVSKK